MDVANADYFLCGFVYRVRNVDKNVTFSFYKKNNYRMI